VESAEPDLLGRSACAAASALACDVPATRADFSPGKPAGMSGGASAGTRGASTSEYTYSYSDSSEASRIRVLGEDVPFFVVDGDFALAGVLEVAQLGAQVGAWVIVAGAASAAGATPELLGGFEPRGIMPLYAPQRCALFRDVSVGVRTSGRIRQEVTFFAPCAPTTIQHDAPNSGLPDLSAGSNQDAT